MTTHSWRRVSRAEHSWQSRAATRWGTRRANGDVRDDWADVV